MRKKNSSLFFHAFLFGVRDALLKKIWKDLLILQLLKNHTFQLFSLFSLRFLDILSSLSLSIRLYRTTEISISSNLLRLLIEKSLVLRIPSLNSLLSFTSNSILNQLQQRQNNAEQLSNQTSSYLSNKIKSSKGFNFYTSNLPAKFTNRSP